MCYAIPGKVISVNGRIAVVDYFGEHRNVLNEINSKVNDYVYAQGGVAVQIINEKRAKEILKEWKDIFFQLKKKDLQLSKMSVKKPSESMKAILKKNDLSRDDIITLLAVKGADKDSLIRQANVIRHRNLKNSCCVHGIIEFSNRCVNNCLYCGIRKRNSRLSRYRMSVNEIITLAEYAVNDLGFKALVLQSGEDPWYTDRKLIGIIKGILEKCGVLIFMSVGTRSLKCYQQMYDAGARGILLRFETSNRTLYQKVHQGPKSDFDKRLDIIRYCQNIGYIVATGSLVGLPGQTIEDIADDLLLIKSLGAEMWSFGPFIPHPDTPFALNQPGRKDDMINLIAVSRLIKSDSKILVTTALETIDKVSGRKDGLLAGANSLMIDVTPEEYKKKYSIYPNRSCEDIGVRKGIDDAVSLLYSIGRAPTDLGRIEDGPNKRIPKRGAY